MQAYTRVSPLFTVYSPDLVQTQREFLLAQQNEKSMAGSGIEGVASGSVARSPKLLKNVSASGTFPKLQLNP